MTCEGRLVWPAILVMDMELVLDARTASGFTTCPHHSALSAEDFSSSKTPHDAGVAYIVPLHAAAGSRLVIQMQARGTDVDRMTAMMVISCCGVQEDAHIIQQAEGSPLDSLILPDCLHDKV